jgi:hypothetical protein
MIANEPTPNDHVTTKPVAKKWFHEIVYWISRDDVDDFCESRGEPFLSDEELEELFTIILEDHFGTQDIIDDALESFRTGVRRHCR